MNINPEASPQPQEVAVEETSPPNPETDTQTAAPFEKADTDPMQPQEVMDIPDEEDDEDSDGYDDDEEDGEEPAAPNLVRPSRSFLGKVVGFIDDAKADICQALAQDEKPEKYKNTKENREEFANELNTYLGQIDFKISAGQNFFIVCLMFFCPALFIAGRERMKKNRAKKQAALQKNTAPNENSNPTQTTQSTSPEQAPNSNPFATTPEYQAKRKKFELHSNGTYKHDPDGEYLKVENAKETPSEMIKFFISQGLNNAEIKKIMGYG